MSALLLRLLRATVVVASVGAAVQWWYRREIAKHPDRRHTRE